MKIKSFTMIEIIFVMIISVMISTAIYFLFTKINKQFYDYYSIKKSFFEYQIFDNQVREDVFKSDEITLSDDKSFILKIANNKIQYQIRKHKLVRNIINKDTESSFEIINYNFNKINNEIPYFTIQYKVEDLNISSFYFKDYGLAYKINKNY